MLLERFLTFITCIYQNVHREFQEPLNVIHGAKSFNSGKPVANNSFLYTFDEDGSYTVASQGAPGFYCTIVVMDVGM